MNKYKRLSFEEREEISRSLALRIGMRSIARALNRSPSTISREIRKGLGPKARWKYRAVKAHKRAWKNSRKRKLGHHRLNELPELFKIICEKLRLYWTPEQISNWLKKSYDDRQMHVSTETIYTYLYVLPRGQLRKELLNCLRRKQITRRKKGHTQKGQTSNLEDMISIEERPAEVADRSVPGHWEGDLIIGGQREQTALGTLVERTTRSVLLIPVKSKKAEDVRKSFAKEIKKLPKEMRVSMTYDQGREMAQHKLFTKETKMKVFFAHPRSPWERGTNENTNGLIRQFFPKNTMFNEISRREIKRVQHLLNDRPRKILGWSTPYEAMEELLR
ncbi:IS30 family transposase [bacterium K02(2017)]|nr:IS30 family transposase [bacterium K02(2017)]